MQYLQYVVLCGCLNFGGGGQVLDPLDGIPDLRGKGFFLLDSHCLKIFVFGIAFHGMLFAPRQIQFINEANSVWNFAHGSVRSGKTVCVIYKYLDFVRSSEGGQHWITGHSSSTVYDNVIRPVFEAPELNFFRHFCTWTPGKKILTLGDKRIGVLGAKDEGAIGAIQGKTFDSCMADEITLYPENVIQMITTRLSNPQSRFYATMNPVQPSHIVKKWIDMGVAGDKNIYSLHFNIEHNPFLPESYKKMLRNTLSGLFYKRNYLGEWCLADGAIFDFFDEKIHVVKRVPRVADFYIVGIDYGTSNPFAAVMVGYCSGHLNQEGVHMWVEKEYYYSPKERGRQQTNSEFADDVLEFCEGYNVKAVYIDPSAESFQLELRRRQLRAIHANNDVLNGLQTVTRLLKDGTLTIMANCKNLIREIEGYVWDPAKAREGIDAPLKREDHCVDAFRYSIASYVGKKTNLQIPDQEKQRQLAEQQERQRRWPHGFGFQSF